MEKLMSCDTNTEIMESLFEQVQEEYPDLPIEQQATIASTFLESRTMTASFLFSAR